MPICIVLGSLLMVGWGALPSSKVVAILSELGEARMVASSCSRRFSTAFRSGEGVWTETTLFSTLGGLGGAISGILVF